MRVITKSVIDIESGKTLIEESYQYDGEVALCKGDSGPSAEEREFQTAQTESLKMNQKLLQESLDRQNLLEPFFFESAGLEAQRDEEGKIIGFDKIEDPLEGLRGEVEETLLTRALAASKGEIPEYLTDFRAEQRLKMEDVLRRQLGPDFATSSAGMEALRGFDKETAMMGEQLNLQELGLVSGTSLAREGAQTGRTMDDLNLFGASSEFGASRLAPAFGDVAGRYEAPLGRMSQERISREQNEFSSIEALFGAAGTVAGGFVGGPAGAAIGTKLFGEAVS